VELLPVLFQRRFISVGLFLAVAAMAGCSGGSTAGPAPSVTATPGSSNTTLVAIPAAGGTVALTAVAGITPGFSIGSGAPSGLTASTTASVTAPSGAPALSVARKTQSATSPITPFLYVTATFSANVPSGVVLSELLQLASSLPANADYYCALTDLTAVSQTATFGPAVPVNGIVTISNGSAASTPAFTAGHTYLFEFYELPISTATPTPSPSPTASGSATPTPAPSATATGNSSPAPSPSPTQTSAGTATAPPVFTFTGPSATSASVTPPTVPAAISVGNSYGPHDAHVSIQLGAATSSAAYTMTATLGSVGIGDIGSSNFPYYSGNAATPLFYVELTPSVPVTFSQTPAVTVTVNSFGSSNSCSLFIYGNTGGSAYQWIQVPNTTETVSGTTVAIPAAAAIGTQVNYSPTQAQVGFIGC
jgi:hypothetical protein